MSRNRITRRRKGNRITTMDGREISREEHERRKAEVLEQGGIFMDLDERTGMLKLSISPEAEARIAKEAAEQGLDFETHMQQGERAFHVRPLPCNLASKVQCNTMQSGARS
jgi:hypothetical protein